MDERRRHERKALLLEVRWESLSGIQAARTTDISLGGCYIESLAQVKVGERIQIEIQLPTGHWMQLKGEVVYHYQNIGFGVRFIDLTGPEQKVLAQTLDQHP